jgi:hypothetical protein
MAGLDAYFTPEPLARQMVHAVERGNVEAILDPAAGDGALLRSASERWPYARMVAAEIDSDRARALAASTKNWYVQACDFLAHEALARLTACLRNTARTSVLLNPPFSSRGGTRWTASPGGESTVRASRAMAFVLGASAFVGSEGQLVALVPASVLTSERDAHARRWLGRQGSLEEVSRPHKRTFAGTVAETVVLRWTPNVQDSVLESVEDAVPVQGYRPEWDVIRGSRQMHTVDPTRGRGTVRLIHTTNLLGGRIAGPNVRIVPTHRDRLVTGPVVLLPRVGRPDCRKVVLHRGGRVALSDCVFAVTYLNESPAAELCERLILDFERLRACFGGTGAPYLRRESLQCLIAQLEGATDRA